MVAVGTGQALDIGRRGDADVVFVHDKAAEEKFVAEGLRRQASGRDVQRLRHRRARRAIRPGPRARTCSPACEGSRRRRRPSSRAATGPALTRRSCATGRMPASISRRIKGEWYKEIGQGMGPALNTASAQNAYVLADRGTWLSFKNRGDLAILVEGDERLFNQYGVMLVNPARHPHVKAAGRPGLHRLARLARRAEGHRGLQDRRRAALLPERRRVGSLLGFVEFALTGPSWRGTTAPPMLLATMPQRG